VAITAGLRAAGIAQRGYPAGCLLCNDGLAAHLQRIIFFSGVPGGDAGARKGSSPFQLPGACATPAYANAFQLHDMPRADNGDKQKAGAPRPRLPAGQFLRFDYSST